MQLLNEIKVDFIATITGVTIVHRFQSISQTKSLILLSVGRHNEFEQFS